MKVTAGLDWVISCTPDFERSVAFFRDVLGLDVAKEGVPVTDTQFTRYVQFKLPSGGVLEIVEPDERVRQLYTAPIPSFTVDDLAEACQELERQDVELVAPIFNSGEGWGWTYFRAPDGHIYQLQGAYHS